MGIYRRGRRWQVKRRGPSGEWWVITVADQATAKKHDADMQLAWDRGLDWQDPRARTTVVDVTLEDVALSFISAKQPTLAAKTLLRYARELDEFSKYAATQGSIGIHQLTRGLVGGFIRYLSSPDRPRKLQPITVAKTVKTVLVFWRWAWDHTDDFPAWAGKVPQPREVEVPRTSSDPRPAPSWGDMDDMLSALDDGGVEWARRLAWIQRAIGSRVSETVQLRWSDVDLDNAQLRFRALTTKAASGGRVVYLPAWLVKEMRVWAIDPADPWVCTEVGRRTAGTSRGARVLATAWEAAGVAPSIWDRRGTHALRAGVQTGLTALGWQPDAVRLLVGHKLDELRRVYVDPAQAFDLRALVASIPEPGAEVPGGRLRGQLRSSDDE